MSSRARFLEGFAAGYRSARLGDAGRAVAVTLGGVIALAFLAR
jgi:hypothetical protein